MRLRMSGGGMNDDWIGVVLRGVAWCGVVIRWKWSVRYNSILSFSSKSVSFTIYHYQHINHHNINQHRHTRISKQTQRVECVCYYEVIVIALTITYIKEFCI